MMFLLILAQSWHQKFLLMELPLKRTVLILFHHLPHLFFFRILYWIWSFSRISEFKWKKAIGIEIIPIRFLKTTSEITSSLLSNLFNKCMIRGTFPNRLKIAEVTPLYKSGPTHKTTNYRPISILAPFSKIIYNRLNNYFSPQNVLTKEQFGFRTKHSTIHVISDVTNKLQHLRDNNYSTELAWYY